MMMEMTLRTHDIKVVWFANGVWGVGILGVRASPEIELIFSNGRIVSSLISSCIIVGHVEESCPVYSVFGL